MKCFQIIAAVLLAGCTLLSCNREDKAVLEQVREIYNEVAEQPFASEELTEKYCTADWERIVSDVMARDSRYPGEIGFFEADYWIQGQDCDGLSIRKLALEERSGDNASVTFDLVNLGSVTPMRLLLVREEGRWRIDDFITLGESPFDWKAAMQAYLEAD